MVASLVGIDVGTSACKAVAINEDGDLLAKASHPHRTTNPFPLWSEQDPEDWWAGVQSCLDQLRVGGVSLKEAEAIGLTGQMHGAVFLDGAGRPVRPAILWNDQRTAAECREIDDIVSPARVREVTCNPPLTGFQLPKVLWLRRHEPTRFDEVRSVLLPKDYVRFRMTGSLFTEPTDASGTGLFDVRRRTWSGEMADALGLPIELFPESVESTAFTGSAYDGVPVVAGAGDQAAGAVGTGTVEQGMVSVALGTSGVVFSPMETAHPDPQGALHTFCHANGKWHAMGVMLACGGALGWYRDSVRSAASFEQIAQEASRAAPGCDGLTFLPYLSGERSPLNDPEARAAWAGLTMSHGPSHLSRAVYEGVSFGLADSLDRLLDLGASCEEVRVTGGGARSPFWMQMLSDVFERPCRVMQCDEGPAFGAAVLAGVGAGLWPDVETACRKTVKLGKTYVPSSIQYREAIVRYRQMARRLSGAWSGEGPHSVI